MTSTQKISYEDCIQIIEKVLNNINNNNNNIDIFNKNDIIKVLQLLHIQPTNSNTNILLNIQILIRKLFNMNNFLNTSISQSLHTTSTSSMCYYCSRLLYGGHESSVKVVRWCNTSKLILTIDTHGIISLW